jgi:hypothetical protein
VALCTASRPPSLGAPWPSLCSLSSHPLIAAAVAEGNVTTFAGFSVSNDDDFPFNFGPSGGSSDGSYALVADTGNNLIRHIILSTASVTTLAGLASSSGSADGVGSNARFYRPNGVSISSDGSYALVADGGNYLIRQIVISTATVSSLAGLALSYGSTNGVGSNALFESPEGVSVSSDGSYALVADFYNHLIRKIIISTATVSSLAGLALSYGSTNGVGSNALFKRPSGVSISSDGSYALVVDRENLIIRQIILSTSSVSTLAGLNSSYAGSTDGVGSNTRFNLPYGVSISPDGSYALVADQVNHLIRKIIISTASVSSLAGLASSSGSTNGVGSNALFNNPFGVSVSSDGSYALVADKSNHLIRKITFSTTSSPTSVPSSSPSIAPSSSPSLAPSCSPTSAPSSSPTSAPTLPSRKCSFGVVFGDPESQGLRVGSALLLDYFISFGDEGLNSFKL